MARRQILFVVNEVYFFASHRLHLAEALLADGYDVHVAAPNDHVWAPDGFDVGELSRLGITLHRIPLSRRGQRPLAELWSLIAITRLILRLKPDILHLLTIKPILYGGIAARIAGTKAVVRAFTGLGQVFYSSGLGARVRRVIVSSLLRIGARRSNNLAVFQNHDDRSVMERLGIATRERARVILGSGVDLSRFEQMPFSNDVPLVVFAGRLIWEKGVGDFAEAARCVMSEGIPCRFAIVGDTHPSNPRAVPEATLRVWVDAGFLEWWGRHDDMPSVLAQSHIVCLPTRYGEGVPKILIEAAACGRPIVATQIAGCRDVVEDGKTGFLVPVEDLDALIAALKTLIESPELRVAMGSAARSLAVQRHDVRRVVCDTMECYNDLLGSGHHAS